MTQIIPTGAQVRRQVKGGAWPMWNDLAGAGMPLLGDPQSQALQPLALVTLPLSLPQAAGVTAGLRVLLALVFFFLLMRRQGLSEGAALFGSLAYGLGGFLLLWLNWPLANSAALFPLVLYGLAITEERGARRDFLLLIVALTALALAGHPETVLYVTIVGGLFALARLLRRERRERIRILGRWALAAGIAFGLAAPALLPSAEFLSQTLRTRQVQARNARMEDRSPLHPWQNAKAGKMAKELFRQRFFTVFAPNAFGNSRYLSYWGHGNTNEDSAGFVGGAALLAALLAFTPQRRFPQEQLFLGIAAASFVVAVQVPGVPQFLRHVPVLDQSASDHRRMLMILVLALAYLGACTVERWRSGEGRPGRWAVTACGALLLGLISWGYLSSPEVDDLLGLRRFWMGLGIATVALTAVIFALKKQAGERLSWALATLVALELIVLHRPANPSMPREEFYPTTPVIGYLQQNAGSYRVAGLADRLLPNSSALYGLADIRISNPFKPGMYVQALGPVSASSNTTEHILIKPEHPLYQLLGVRYLIGRLRYQAAKGQKSVFKDLGSRVFEREKVLERLFLPESAVAPEDQPWPEWLASNRDFAAR
ncbi:MAG TPA: YfhO family protein, partial [Thermoanaerobaculia bacterium]